MKRKKKVSEPSPVQVYLDRDEHERLDRLAQQLDTTKSEVLRRGVRALERQIMSPGAHPALRLIGLSGGERAESLPYDEAVEHDRFLAESEEQSWQSRTSKGRRRGDG
jgi:Arc/MetJ-type ribon-helix-helix transcriptional regulator